MDRFLNHYLDAMTSPTVVILGKKRSAFHMGGCFGLALATILAGILASYRELNLWVMAGIIFMAVGTFFALSMVTKIITGLGGVSTKKGRPSGGKLKGHGAG